ncbi:hypothetical protein PAMP_007552 [Pampus punctatissimus]
MSGQSITDRITAAQHSVTGSAITKTVCKATTHEIMGPKKKHLDSLVVGEAVSIRPVAPPTHCILLMERQSVPSDNATILVSYFNPPPCHATPLGPKSFQN